MEHRRTRRNKPAQTHGYMNHTCIIIYILSFIIQSTINHPCTGVCAHFTCNKVKTHTNVFQCICTSTYANNVKLKVNVRACVCNHIGVCILVYVCCCMFMKIPLNMRVGSWICIYCSSQDHLRWLMVRAWTVQLCNVDCTVVLRYFAAFYNTLQCFHSNSAQSRENHFCAWTNSYSFSHMHICAGRHTGACVHIHTHTHT